MELCSQGSEDESAAGGGSGAEIRNMSRDFSGARLEKKRLQNWGQKQSATEEHLVLET